MLHVRVIQTASYCGSSHKSTCEQYQRGGVLHGVLDHDLPDGAQLRSPFGITALILRWYPQTVPYASVSSWRMTTIIRQVRNVVICYSLSKRQVDATGMVCFYGAAVLAFPSGQLHSLMMLLIVTGLGSADMDHMAAVSTVRRAMLLLSLAMLVMLASQIRDSRRPGAVGIAGLFSIGVAVAIGGWSVLRFGL
jgi:hypothetical protein